MARRNDWAPVALFFALILSAPVLGQGARSQPACAQVRRACEDAGFIAGGSKGNRLLIDCVEPILAGRTNASGGLQLPRVDPALVAACTGKSTTMTDAGVAGPGGLKDRLGARNSDGLMMSQPVAIFTGTQLGLNAMPDQQTPVLRDPSGRYQLYLTGVRPGRPGGVVVVFSTSDLTQPSAYRNEGMILAPPKQKGATGNCDARDTDACATYLGMTSVFETGMAHHFIGFYIADQTSFANGVCGKGVFYGQLGVATSKDGKKWTPHGPTLRGAEMPKTCSRTSGPIAFNQPTAIKIGGYYYVYFALPTSGKQGIAVARAPVQSDGMPGAWQVLFQGQWTAVPRIDNVPTVQSIEMVVPVQGYTTMPWISYNTYLQTYLLTFVTRDAFYYSKLEKSGWDQPTQPDIDAQKWSAPEVFAPVPGGKNWQRCQVTWENLSFVTPGANDNQTTGKDGFAIFSVVPGWSCGQRSGRSFSIARYAFGVTTPPAPPAVGPSLLSQRPRRPGA